MTLHPWKGCVEGPGVHCRELPRYEADTTSTFTIVNQVFTTVNSILSRRSAVMDMAIDLEKRLDRRFKSGVIRNKTVGARRE